MAGKHFTALAPAALAAAMLFPRGGETLGAPGGHDAAGTVERRPAGVTPEVEGAIERGTGFLVRTQNGDGSWSNQIGWGQYPTAMTALCGTALLASGSTASRGPHARAIRKAVEFVLRA